MLLATRILKKQLAPMSGIDVYKKHGITKKQLHSLLVNIFHFPAEYRDCLQNYHLLHWEGAWFSARLIDGSIAADNDDYLVVYQACTPYQAKRAKQLRLSFRKPHADFGLPSYVIVKVLVDSDGNCEE